jgi:hypothetical protein
VLCGGTPRAASSWQEKIARRTLRRDILRLTTFRTFGHSFVDTLRKTWARMLEFAWQSEEGRCGGETRYLSRAAAYFQMCTGQQDADRAQTWAMPNWTDQLNKQCQKAYQGKRLIKIGMQRTTGNVVESSEIIFMLFRLNVTSPLSLHKIFKGAPKNWPVFPALGILTRHNRTSIEGGLQQRQSFWHQPSLGWVSTRNRLPK